jgi:superfamily II DNA helicase RecQ
MQMNRVGIASAALTQDHVQDDPALWQDVKDGVYNLVFVTPEIALRPTSYFSKNILRDRKCAFLKQLLTVAIDECHCIWEYGGFRDDYKHVGRLRKCLPDVPFVLLTATLPPHIFRYIEQLMQLKDTQLLRHTIRRPNITMAMAPVLGKGFEDLSHLIQHTATFPHHIPMTMIFTDSVRDGIAIKRYLTKQLPRVLASKSHLILTYFADLDPETKKQTLQGLYDETTRIIICTDACGMGIHIPAVNRVIQWKVTGYLTINRLYQRLGRGGRRKGSQAVGLVYVGGSLLGKDSQIIANSECTFRTAITPESYDEVKTVLDTMYRHEGDEDEEDGKKTKTLDPGVRWVCSSTGCRHNVFLAIYRDPDLFKETEPCQACDNCIVARSRDAETCGSISIEGIDMSITAAYREKYPTPKVVRSTAGKSHAVTRERRELLRKALEKWRDQSWARFRIGRRLRFLDEQCIQKLTSQRANLSTSDHVKQILMSTNRPHMFPESYLTPHIESLMQCISNSLRDSEQLQNPKQRRGAPKARPGDLQSLTRLAIPQHPASQLLPWLIPTSTTDAVFSQIRMNPRQALADITNSQKEMFGNSQN